MSADAERRSRLLSVKLRALVRDHLGLVAEPEGVPHVFALGAAFVTSDAVWVLVDGDARRCLGPVLSWSLPHGLPINLLVERDSGLLARRIALMSVDATVWHINERSLLPAVAEPHVEASIATESHLAFVPMIEAAGADAVVEHGVVVGEVRGLEMCRVVDDATTGEARLEVGMGAHDREAFAMVHGELPTEDALRQVIDSVRGHREDGADMHPFNQFGRERLHRWRALCDPSSVGCVELIAANPPVVRSNVKDAIPCVAVGTDHEGHRVCVVFVHGVDLDVVPFAVDAASMHGTDRVVIAARRRDVTPSIEKLAAVAKVRVDVAHIGS